MPFKDHFSRQAAAYRAFRPSYPPGLFLALARFCRGHALACDCATGNGQAAQGLARHFRQVAAIDASLGQLASRQPAANVFYIAAQAEQLPLRDVSADLLVVAQALHWFDLPAFYQEARRVLKPGGIIAAWTYDLSTISPEVDAVQKHFHDDIVGPFWPPERRFIQERYQGLAFPFERVAIPALQMECSWNLDEYLGYISTWSAVERYRQSRAADPLAVIEKNLALAWGEAADKKKITWPLTILAGRT